MIVTIDGPIATGKSTVAKKLAHELGFIFFDTGAMYRCLAYSALKNHIDIEDQDKLTQLLGSFSFDIKTKQGVKRYYVDREDVTDLIRQEEVTYASSKISTLKPVREKLIKMQRNLAVGVNAVFEGRDMGTTVFPEADLKIFLTGREDVRAKRRFEELRSKFPEETKNLTLEKCMKDIQKRDQLDTEREISPLRKAEDAFVLDTSDLTLDEVVLQILEYRDSQAMKRKQSHQ